MLKRIHHLGIIVDDLEKRLKDLRSLVSIAVR